MTSKTSLGRCMEKTRLGGFGFPRYRQCDHSGRVVRDGKPYCNVHDPERVMVRRAKRTKAAEEKYALRTRLWKLHISAPKLLAAAKAILASSDYENDKRPLMEALREAVRDSSQ